MRLKAVTCCWVSGNGKKILTAPMIVLLVLSVFAGTTLYFAGVVNERNSKINSLNSQIAQLNSENLGLNREIATLNDQISNLSGQVKKLTSANIETALGATDVPYDSPHNMPSPLLYNHLYIEGSVSNTGKSAAYNVGLQVVCYAAGDVTFNMTVPLTGTFGTDSDINAYLTSKNLGVSSMQLGSMYSGQNASVGIAIYHEGTVSNWTITPVWSNTP